MFRLRVSRKSLLSTAAMRRYARRMLGDPRLEDLPIPVAVVATDVDTQDEVVLRRGSIVSAVFASAAVPGVFPAVRLGTRTLVDGGVVNPVPASAAAALGADVVIGVRLVHSMGIQADEVSEEGEGPIPSAVAAIMRSIELLQTRIGIDSGSVPLVLVTPHFESLPAGKLRNFREGRRYIGSGEAAVEEALPRLGAALPWLRPVGTATAASVPGRT
jgi:NTE family protein